MQQQVNTVAIDLAKKVFHLVGTDTTGKILWRKRLTRQALVLWLSYHRSLLAWRPVAEPMTGPDVSARMAMRLN
jgi:hypothetical protein